MSKIPAILINYNFDPKWWWLDYDLDVAVYDRSDDGIQRTFNAPTYRTANIGDVDADKLSYLIENYDNLPEIFLWSKSNIFKYCDEQTLKDALEKREFAPLLKKDHRIYSDKMGAVNKYVGTNYGLVYAERNDGWYLNAGLDTSGRFLMWSDWALKFGLPMPDYMPFAPGGSYLLTKERVHRYSKDFYTEMRDTLTYAMHPVEAHLAERSYFMLWR